MGVAGKALLGRLGTYSLKKRGTTVIPFCASTAQKCPTSSALSLPTEQPWLSGLAGKARLPQGSSLLSQVYFIPSSAEPLLSCPSEAQCPSAEATLSLYNSERCVPQGGDGPPLPSRSSLASQPSPDAMVVLCPHYSPGSGAEAWPR